MGKVLITGGGGAGGMSDDMTAANGVTADLVPKGQTYIGADTDDEIGTGTMELEATANAQTAHVLNGEKFFTKNEQLPDKPLTGTMPNIGALDTTTKARISGNYLVLGMSNGAHIQNGGSGTTGVPEVQMSFDEISKNASLKGQINAGIIKKNSKILGVTGTYTGDGNANRGDVLVGKTFSSANGIGLQGTIPNNGYYKYASGFGSGKENNVDYVAFNNIPVGYYGESTSNATWAPEIRMKESDFKNHIITKYGITANKIAYPYSICGVVGTNVGGAQKGTVNYIANGTLGGGWTESNLGSKIKVKGYGDGTPGDWNYGGPSITKQPTYIRVKTGYWNQQQFNDYSSDTFWLTDPITMDAYSQVTMSVSGVFTGEHYVTGIRIAPKLYGEEDWDASDLRFSIWQELGRPITFTANVSKLQGTFYIGFTWQQNNARFYENTGVKDKSGDTFGTYSECWIHNISIK